MKAGNFWVCSGADSFKLDQGGSVFDIWVSDSSISHLPRNILRACNSGTCIVLGQGCNANNNASIPVYACHLVCAGVCFKSPVVCATTHFRSPILRIYNSGASSCISLQTCSGSERGFLQARETAEGDGNAGLNIATSGGEQIYFRDGGVAGTVNMHIDGAGVVGVCNCLISPTLCATTKVNFGACATSYICSENNYMKLQTQHGYGRIGANNSSWFHFYTDMPGWYFGSSKVYADICFYSPRICGETCVQSPIVCATTCASFLALGLNAAACTNAYKLNMGGSVHMHSNSIDYISQLHFNSNVRFYQDSNDSDLFFKSGDTGQGSIKFLDGNGTRRGRVYWDGGNQFGLLNCADGWSFKSVSNTHNNICQKTEIATCVCSPIVCATSCVKTANLCLNASGGSTLECALVFDATANGNMSSTFRMGTSWDGTVNTIFLGDSNSRTLNISDEDRVGIGHQSPRGLLHLRHVNNDCVPALITSHSGATSGSYSTEPMWSRKWLLHVTTAGDVTQNDANSKIVRLQLPASYADANGASGTIKISYLQGHAAGHMSFEYKFGQYYAGGTTTYSTWDFGTFKIQKTGQLYKEVTYLDTTKANYIKNNIKFYRHVPASGTFDTQSSGLVIKIPNSGTSRVVDISVEIEATGRSGNEDKIKLQDLGTWTANAPSGLTQLTPTVFWLGDNSDTTICSSSKVCSTCCVQSPIVCATSCIRTAMHCVHGCTTLGSTGNPQVAGGERVVLRGYSTQYDSGGSGCRLSSSGFLEFWSAGNWTGSERRWAMTNAYCMGSSACTGNLAFLLGGYQVSPVLANNGALGTGTSIAMYITRDKYLCVFGCVQSPIVCATNCIKAGIIRAGIAGNSSANKPALEVVSSGTGDVQAAIAIQQVTSEGDTILFADYEPHVEWGMSHENSDNAIHITGGSSTANMGSKTFYNCAGSARTAYIKQYFNQNTGQVKFGADLVVCTCVKSPIVCGTSYICSPKFCSSNSYFCDECLAFGWGGGWYQTEATKLCLRGGKIIHSTGVICSTTAVCSPTVCATGTSGYTLRTAGCIYAAGQVRGEASVYSNNHVCAPYVCGSSYVCTAGYMCSPKFCSANSYFCDECLTFGWGGGWFQTEATKLCLLGGKILHSTGVICSTTAVCAPIVCATTCIQSPIICATNYVHSTKIEAYGAAGSGGSACGGGAIRFFSDNNVMVAKLGNESAPYGGFLTSYAGCTPTGAALQLAGIDSTIITSSRTGAKILGIFCDSGDVCFPQSGQLYNNGLGYFNGVICANGNILPITNNINCLGVGDKFWLCGYIYHVSSSTSRSSSASASAICASNGGVFAYTCVKSAVVCATTGFYGSGANLTNLPAGGVQGDGCTGNAACCSVVLGYGAKCGGYHNTHIGESAGAAGGYGNTAIGKSNAQGTGTRYYNTTIGFGTGMNLTSGCYNLFWGAGYLAWGVSTGSHNIFIASAGNPGNTTGCLLIGSGNMCDGLVCVPSVTFSGSVSKTSGSFRIVHPDPAKSETKDLWHSFVESPNEGDNIYRYSIDTTDCRYVIELPDYYPHLNKDDQVWVSPVGHFGAAYGAVTENQLCAVICANTDGCYNVLLVGTRKDPAARSAWKGVSRDINTNSPHVDAVHVYGDPIPGMPDDAPNEILSTTYPRDMSAYQELIDSVNNV